VKVVQATSFGGPDVLAAVPAPDPAAGPGEVVVRVTAADVLFFDTMIRRGLAIDFVPLRPPYVPGSGVAGQVIAAGRGVNPEWIGSWVAAHTGGTGGGGGYAEQALVPAAALVPVPDGVYVQAAAALLHDGATALGLAENVGIEAGDWVLVVGTGGGLGLLLVQLARAAGALSWPVIQSRVCSQPLKPSCHQPKPPEASEGASTYTNSMSAESEAASGAI